MRNHCVPLMALLLACGVCGVSAGVKVTVSVIKGDSVTLNSGTGIPERYTVEWWFGGKIIARMNKRYGLFSTSEGDDVGFKGRLKLDEQNGCLTITNITPEDFGLYQQKIKIYIERSTNEFNVSVNDEMMIVSVKEGESVTLRISVTEIQEYDLMLWKFGDDIIGQIHKGTKFSVFDTNDKRFKGRLQLSETSGSLFISDSRSTDSGVYHLQMSSNSHTVQRNISVTVKNSGLFSSAVGGIVAVVLLLVFVAAIVICCKQRN